MTRRHVLSALGLILFGALSYGTDKKTPLPLLDLEQSTSSCADTLLQVQQSALTPAYFESTPVHLNGQPGKRLMLVFRTNGCYYDRGESGCTMCDFKRHAISPTQHRVSAEDLMAQYEHTVQTLGAEQFDQIDLLTLGNFLHRQEVPVAFWKAIMEKLSSLRNLKKVVIESRAPFITRENLSLVRTSLNKRITLEVSLGVETSNHTLRNEILKKGLPWKNVEESFQTISEFKGSNVEAQVYLLIKPQTLTERQAIEDAIQSAKDIALLAKKTQVTTRIAFEPVFITQGTPLETEYLAGTYAPVNLWSAIEIIQRVAPQLNKNPYVSSLFIGLSDENLSKKRMAQSCSQCQKALWTAIQKYNGSQDLSEFSDLSCPCKPTSESSLKLKLNVLGDTYALTYLSSDTRLPTWAQNKKPYAIVENNEGLTLITPASSVPWEVKEEYHLRALKIVGSFQDKPGVLKAALTKLSDAGISVLVSSEKNTDYLFIRLEDFDRATLILKTQGHQID